MGSRQPELKLKRWRVKVHRWEVYEARNVEAETEMDAEEKALAQFELADLEWIDGGLNLVDAEPEDD
jgi:hypothetical protein